MSSAMLDTKTSAEDKILQALATYTNRSTYQLSEMTGLGPDLLYPALMRLERDLAISICKFIAVCAVGFQPDELLPVAAMRLARARADVARRAWLAVRQPCWTGNTREPA
jgi:hypothetical protein